MTEEILKPIVAGQGGGGGKGGVNDKSDDDTLRSHAYARFVDAISEGEIVGLVNGPDSIYINQTPIRNVTGSAWQFRSGTPDSPPLEHVDSTEAFVNVGATVSQELGAVTRTITDTSLGAVRIFMQVNNLFRIADSGALKVADGGYYVAIRSAGGDWRVAVANELQGQKVTSGTQFQHTIPLDGAGPWDIQLRARFPKRDKHEESLTWSGMGEITYGKFTHPHTALVAVAVSSEHVGSSTPARLYHVKGRIVLVPTNYDPDSRSYTGVWDGTFKRAYTNNPAWVFYDMVENNVFGIGDHVDISVVNKWRLYTIAQYCDQMVPTGYRNGAGQPTMEPRYTFNGTITNKQSAFDALRAITNVWRGMGFYARNQFFTTVDMPQDAAFIYGSANVEDGRFEYSTSSTKSRHSVVLVRFNDPNNMFEPAIEPYVDDEALKMFGWREKTLELTGCSSRSLARRYGRWVTETEKRETETVGFTVGLDSIHALPGEIIGINDPRRAQVRLSGRIAGFNKAGRTLVLDKHVPDGITGTITIRVQTNTGTLTTHTGTIGTDRSIITTTGDATDFDRFQLDAVYLISSAQVTPRLYRIISIEESQGGKAKITALQYDPNKFASVERGISFEPLPTKVDITFLEPPSGLTVTGISYAEAGRIRNDLEVKWEPSSSFSVKDYLLLVDTPSQSGVTVGSVNRTSMTYTTYEPGTYKFRLQAVSITNARSAAITANYTVEGLSAISMGSVDNLVNAANLQSGMNARFDGTDVRLKWRNMMKVSSVAGVQEVDSDHALYAHTMLEIYFGNTKVRTERVKGNSYTYTLEMNRADAAEIGLSDPQRSFTVNARVVDYDGRTSGITAIKLTNPAPTAIVPIIDVEDNKFNMRWDVGRDTDLVGYEVHIRTDSQHVNGTMEPVSLVRSNTYRHVAISNTFYYVTVAAYDAFGRQDLNYATPMEVRSGWDSKDLLPPDPPSGLTLNGVINDETSKVDVEATWDQNLEADIDYYQFEVTIDGKSFVQNAVDTSVTFAVNQSEMISARVRVSDKVTNWSDWSEAVTFVAETDTIPPATPLNFTLKGAWGAFMLEWTASPEPDLSHYEIWEASASGTPSSGTAARYTSLSNVLMLTGYADNARRWFAVRAVDRGGNKSGWTTVRNLQLTTVAGAIQNAINNSTWTDELGFITPHVGASLPTTSKGKTISWNGKLYTWNGTAYVSAADFSDIAFEDLNGTIDAGQLPANIITPEMIATDLEEMILEQGQTASADKQAAEAAAALAQIAKGLAEDALASSQSVLTQTEVALTGANSAKTAAEAAKAASETALTGANSAKTAAETARNAAQTARNAAQTARTDAQTALANTSAIKVEVEGLAADTVDAAEAAEAARAAAHTARTAAETALSGANTAKTDAQTAATNAGAANTAAQTAKTDAQSAKTAAETARTGAQTARTEAQTAATTATTQATNAGNANTAAQSAKTAAETARADAQAASATATTKAGEAATAATNATTAANTAAGYRNETQTIKQDVLAISADVTLQAGVVSAARETSVLASGNERFQFEMLGWVATGGKLTKLADYRIGAVDAVFVFDAKNNVTHGIAVNFARASTSTVTINGTNHTIAANKPRYFVTAAEGRFLRISSGETAGLAAALGPVDMRITYANGSVTTNKNVSRASGWWPGNGDFASIVAWPAGTLP